jgi:hypothetical protein
MKLKLNIDALAINWGGPDQQRTDRCSICEVPFDEDDIPLGAWSSDGWAAAFCDACVKKYIEVAE